MEPRDGLLAADPVIVVQIHVVEVGVEGHLHRPPSGGRGQAAGEREGVAGGEGLRSSRSAGHGSSFGEPSVVEIGGRERRKEEMDGE